MLPVVYGTALRQLFKYLSDLRAAGNGETADAVRAGLRQQLDAVMQDCVAHQWLKQPTQSVHYALVALVDESVMGRGDALSRTWAMRPLQLECFGEFTAGRGFFERLDLLLTAEKADPEVLHVYWLCLKYGFKGELVLQGEGALQVWLDRLVSQGFFGVSGLSPAASSWGASTDSGRNAVGQWRGRWRRIFSRTG
jgi:type IV/VI secretion system ImpK/VasF family protein